MIDDFMWGYNSGSYTGGSGQSTPRNDASAEEIHQLNERLDKLTLINMAMWTLIQEVTKLTDVDLLERIKQIDLMDGKEDGKITRQVAKCSSCHRVMNQRHEHCLYCGHERLIISAFDKIT